jgi:hypothetical protein
MPVANTDNKGHLICHIFCNLFLLSRQICNSLYRDHSSAFNKTLCTLTCDLLAIKFVPRHSYSSTSFLPGRQKMRHASFIPAGIRTLPRFGISTPVSIHLATQTPFIAGPLAVRRVLYGNLEYNY